MTPIVLLHAFPFDASMFDGQKDLNVIALNLRGFGGQPVKRPVSMSDQADHVIAELDRRGIEKAIVGGVSMGGYVSFALVHKYPHRVAGLILADTRADGDDDTAKANRAKALQTVAQSGVAALIDGQIQRLVGTTTTDTKPDVVERVKSIACRQTPEGVMAGVEMIRDRPNWSNSLASIRVATLIIVGEEDVITPPELAKAMHAGIAGSTLVTIPKAGHLANMEDPTAFNKAIRDWSATVVS